MAINDICAHCGEVNPTPRFRWCPDCRETERLRKTSAKLKRDRGIEGCAARHRPGEHHELVFGFQCRPGHAPGWWEVM